MREQWYTSMGNGRPDTPRPPLAEGEVRLVGDPVALVVAVDRYVAEDAADLVEVDYDPLPPVVDYVDRRRRTTSWCTTLSRQRRRHDRSRRPTALDDGVRRRRPTTSARPIHQQAYAPVPMETRGIVVEWSGDELTVWAATQAPHEVRLFARPPARASPSTRSA